jgi:chemotaxis protein CheD
MQEVIRVGMAELKAGKAPLKVASLGLGSCVGVCAYDAKIKVGGIAHIMLPFSSMSRGNVNLAKFADTAIPLLLEEMVNLGASQSMVVLKIAGGAEMFSVDRDERFSIGSRNIQAVEEVCQKLGLKILARSVGGNMGKSVILDLETGEVQVKTVKEFIIL